MIDTTPDVVVYHDVSCFFLISMIPTNCRADSDEQSGWHEQRGAPLQTPV